MTTPSPLNVVLAEAARKLVALQMTTLSLDPDRVDLNNILTDLRDVARIFDTVIAEIGDYAGPYFGVPQKEIVNAFHGQVRGALEGNATFILQEAYREISENRAAADDRLWERVS